MTSRRTVFVGLPLACTVAPLLRAQPAPRVIGVLFPWAGGATPIDPFIKGMLNLGYVEGKHFTIESRVAAGSDKDLRKFAEDLVKIKVDLIFAGSTRAVTAAKRATASIPIVFFGVQDPVGSGFAESLAHPGHNITGLTNFASDTLPKRIDLMRQMVTGVNRLAYLFNPTSPLSGRDVQQMQTFSDLARLMVLMSHASTPEHFGPAFKAMTEFGAQALIVQGDPYFDIHIKLIAELALQSRLPSTSSLADLVDAGGLMSYGADEDDEMRRAASYVNKIFRGERAGDIPIEEPIKISLRINRKTATTLNLTIPRALLLLADEIVE